jgi:hypothetical protein
MSHPPYKSLQVVCLVQPFILPNEPGKPHGRLSTSGKIRRVDLLEDTNQNIIAKIKKLGHVCRIALAPFEVMYGSNRRSVDIVSSSQFGNQSGVRR